MAPVAVAPEVQGRGIGQALIVHGCDQLTDHGAALVVTYGDPAYYGKSGFVPVTEAQVPAPLPLSFPNGWQARVPAGATLPTLSGPCTCIPGFRDPAHW